MLLPGIIPSESFVIDRGDPQEIAGRNLLTHSEIGMTIDAEHDTFHIQGDIAKGQTCLQPDAFKVKAHGVITRNDVMELLGVSASTASRTLKKMVDINLLEQNGNARNTSYRLLK